MNAINKKLKKLAAHYLAGNALVLTDGTVINCTGSTHEAICKMAGASLRLALQAGVCRTHFVCETFAIECGRALTAEQKLVIRAILRTVNAHVLRQQIAGVYSTKESFSSPIRGI